jgi:hypothetical protein
MDLEAARATGLQAHLGGWLPGLGADELTRLEKEWQRLEALHYASQQMSLSRTLGSIPTCTIIGAAWRAFDDVLPALAALTATHSSVVLGVVTNGEGAPQRALPGSDDLWRDGRGKAGCGDLRARVRAPGGSARADGARWRQARPRCRRSRRRRTARCLARSHRDRSQPRSCDEDLDAARASCASAKAQRWVVRSAER